jgi:4-amino-4-deoxy-L-arabinose transferase-like glycosyltransferase
LIGAIFFLVNFTMIETGRLAELEAVYIALTGIALILWMTAWRNEAGPWRLWLLPAPFLALGMLTKGPTHLLFFYGIVLPVLAFAKKARSLGHPAHFVSLVVILGAPLCWAIPCSLAIDAGNPTSVWRFWWRELASRASAESDEHFRLWMWLLNGPQTLKNFLPWTLLLPLLWRKETVAAVAAASGSVDRDRALFRGARWGMVATTLIMVLLPNGSPRYIYPLIAVPCLLLGRALTATHGRGVPGLFESIWSRCNLVLLGIISVGIVVASFFAASAHRTLACFIFEALLSFGAWILALSRAQQSASRQRQESVQVTAQAIVSGAIAAIGVMIFTTTALPMIDAADRRRPREVARELIRAIPPGADLWILETGYRPFWYYLEPQARYFHKISDLPPGAHFILSPAMETAAFLQDPGWQGTPPERLIQVVDGERKAFDLLSRGRSQ